MSTPVFRGLVAMVRVTESEDPEAQVVLIVDNNPMNTMRLTQVFTQKGWKSEVCEDGDLAVDTYVEVKPDLVLLALDLPTMDGHTAALEMRESDSHARIAFMSSRSQRKLAADATHSAGAVAWLEKPVTKQIIDDNWEMIMGEIPEAPGLEDLDKLYPDVDVERAKRDGEEIVEVTSALPPLPELPAIPVPVPVATTPSKPKKKGKKLKRLLILILLASAGAGIAWQQGLI
ncbi:MAG: response regulator [Candidatus Thermoplasmatota archaeon]|nr:response regulator [Candidatus Thermoplasmatota archaeon]